jgi:hypothetical protein
MDRIGAGYSLQNTYKWVDVHPDSGTLFHRIKSIDKEGGIKYSPVVSARIYIRGSGFNIYPNPVKNGLINLKFVNQPEGNYKKRLFNHLGQVVLIKTNNHKESRKSEKINYIPKPTSGSYILVIASPVGIIISVKLIFSLIGE